MRPGYGIVGQMHAGQDVRFSVARCEEARKFCNKIWQAVAGFALRTFPELQSAEPSAAAAARQLDACRPWIMDALAQTIARVNQRGPKTSTSPNGRNRSTRFFGISCATSTSSSPRTRRRAERRSSTARSP